MKVNQFLLIFSLSSISIKAGARPKVAFFFAFLFFFIFIEKNRSNFHSIVFIITISIIIISSIGQFGDWVAIIDHQSQWNRTMPIKMRWIRLYWSTQKNGKLTQKLCYAFSRNERKKNTRTTAELKKLKKRFVPSSFESKSVIWSLFYIILICACVSVSEWVCVGQILAESHQKSWREKKRMVFILHIHI